MSRVHFGNHRSHGMENGHFRENNACESRRLGNYR